MGISPLRLFLSTHRNLTTYSRFIKWNIVRTCATSKARKWPSEEIVNGHAASSMPHSGEERSLPDILADVVRDKKIFQNYTDASEAESMASLERPVPRDLAQLAASEFYHKIEDVQKFLDELNKRQEKRNLAKTTESTDESASERAGSSVTDSVGAQRMHVREEITIVVGRKLGRQQLDVSVQEVVDVIRSMEQVDRQIPDVDIIRIPKGRSPMIMALKMWIPQTTSLASFSISELTSAYLRLSKSRLTMFVTLSALGGYFIAPFDFSLLALAGTIVGTSLCSGAANTINQLMEVPFDSQMARTRDRPLVRGQLSPLHALAFAVVSASMGATILYFGVNGIVASLGLLNLCLYTCVYTPMKRFTILNTWAGAVVGAIPPIMGWAAATGSLGVGSLLMAGVLYSWQFPHFNALSWNMRADYSRAGYCMMSVTNPGLCKRVALRHCIFLHVICLLAPVLDVTTWFFACDSFFLNAIFTGYAWKFYRDGDSKSSRNLFRFSLFYLPVVMIFFLISKKREHSGSKKSENFHALSNVLGI